MRQLKVAGLMLFVVLCYFEVQGADKYTDENRPYEFGFSIDGEQHRHEKKDENGIIMGEFGFITADGVYHVTVYATDENGNFKILSMKNIRVKPYPSASGVVGRQGHSLPSPPSQQQSTLHTAAKTRQTKQQSDPSRKSCSHCKLPTTTMLPPKLASLAVISTNNNYGERSHVTPEIQNSLQVNTQEGFNVGRKYLQNTHAQQLYQQQSSAEAHSSQQPSAGLNYQISDAQQYHEKGIVAGQLNLQAPYTRQNQQISNPPQSYAEQTDAKIKDFGESNLRQNYPIQISNFKSQISNPPRSYSEQTDAKIKDFGESNLRQNYPTANAVQNYIQGSRMNDDNNYVQRDTYQNQLKDRQPKTFNDILQTVNPEQHYRPTGTSANLYGSSQPNIAKPVLIAAQMQYVDKNTNIYQRNPGENEGLPKGITKSDMTQLLYTFNYTVGFHGHHEEGYTNGAKIGYYYVTGRNGVRTRVDYVADETGFHPRISQQDLDVQSDEVPKPETEKDEKYGLKGYEFKWLYYPVDSK